MTFSIVAIDPDKGETGFAIASCCWNAGQVCLARPSGAIASQANGNIAFLKTYFDKLADGLNPEQIMQHFMETDPEIDTRQIGMITMSGEKQAFTGNRASFWCGYRTGENYSCQGNILVGPEVIDNMASAFENADGSLYERLFAALEAADAAGGDARGRQSARLFVSKEGAGPPGTNQVIDITIEDHENPIREMARILQIRRNLMNILTGLGEFAKVSDADKPLILRELRIFLDDKRESRYLDWLETLAESYLEIGDRESALEAYRVYLTINPDMTRIFSENAKAGNFSEDMAKALGL